MYHCTLLFSANLDVLHTVLKGKSDELESIPGLKNIRAVPSVPSEVVNLNCFFGCFGEYQTVYSSFVSLLLDRR